MNSTRDRQALIDRHRPVVRFHSAERWTPCSIQSMIANAEVRIQPYTSIRTVDWHAPGKFVAANPPVATLGGYCADNMRLALDFRVYGGEGWNAPMYATVQTDPAGQFVDVNYIFLFAYTGPRCMRFVRPADQFTTSVSSLGEHEGGVESFGIRLSARDQQVMHYRYDAHGASTYYAPQHVELDDGRAVVCLALHSHATYKSRKDDVVLANYQGVAMGVVAIDVLPDTTTNTWTPARVIEVGFDSRRQPVNDQPWIAFKGRLGRSGTAAFAEVAGLDGPLTNDQIAYAGATIRLGNELQLWSTDQDGPFGLATSQMVRQDQPMTPGRPIAIRLKQRPHLALSVNRQDPSGALIAAPYTGAPDQVWQQQTSGDTFSLRNAHSGLVAYGPNDQSAVIQATHPPASNSGLWGQFMTDTIRSARAPAMVMDVLGDGAHPGPSIVGLSPSLGSTPPPNQQWRFDEIGAFMWPEGFVESAIRMYLRPDLALTASATDPMGVTVEFFTGATTQRWARPKYFADEEGNSCGPLVNIATGLALSIGDDGKLVMLNPATIGDDALWNIQLDGLRQIGSVVQFVPGVIRTFRNTSFNLNVLGNDGPVEGKQVGVHKWSHGTSSELWSVWNEPLVVPAREVNIVCAKTAGRTVQPDDVGWVYCQSLDPRNADQIWIAAFYRTCRTFTHKTSGRMLRFNGDRKAVSVDFPGRLTAEYFWRSEDLGIQAVLNPKMNLNVMGSDDPTVGHQVGACDWNEGAPNEVFDIRGVMP